MFDLFKRKQKDVPRNAPEMQEIKKMDISEPILTIIRLLKENRDRFEITQYYDHDLAYLPNYITLSVKDKVNGRTVSIARMGGHEMLLSMGWVTNDEKDLLIKTITEMYDKEEQQKVEDQKILERLEWFQDYQKE